MTEGVEIRAPAEQTEGTRSQVLRWLKHEGDSVAENEPLLEIETDKVTVEIASPGTGVLRQILKHEQEEVAPGELLGRLESADAKPATAAAALSASTASAPARTSLDALHTASAGPARSAAHDAAAAAAPLSPAVRRLLAEHGLDPARISGSGQGGRITVEDVLRAAAGGGAAANAAATTAPASAPAARGETDSAPAEPGVRRVPHTAVRRRIAEHMVHSLLHTAPHVTTVFEASLGAVLQHRAAQRDEFARRGAPLTLTAYFVQAAVTALRAVPEANSRWTASALEIYEAMHIGVATAVEGTGLVVPVLRDAQARDLFETARALDELVSRARAGTLTPADVRGGTFTISNHGVSGSLLAAPIIINQPQSAILGVGKLEKRTVVVEDGDEQKITVQPRCYVTLTIDHRVMDGHQANHFMQTFVQTLEQWPA
jgi:2-oxoglutarate dehydrogenase E2 component (dihydrolipoamide succinyltransferase)